MQNMDNEIVKYDKSALELLFSHKETENGDDAYTTTGNEMLDILFMTEYYTKHPDEVPVLGDDELCQLFAMFIRDPRYGMGRRDLGRVLMRSTGVSYENMLRCGRADDIWKSATNTMEFVGGAAWLKSLIDSDHPYKELIKKWLPRYSSKNLEAARLMAKRFGMTKQEYGHYIKADTVENKMSRNRFNEIDFEKVPSLAAIKYAQAFMRNDGDRYQQYLDDVKAGKKKLNVSTTNVYDVYRNRKSIDADLFFGKLEKISLNCLPIIDVSGSMFDNTDSIGKALSIGHYLSTCSTYAPNQFVTFSARPQFVKIPQHLGYDDQIEVIEKSNWGGNTDLKAVMDLLSTFKGEFPEWIVILSDMEFDQGSCQSMENLHQYMQSIGAETKILWWNFNNRNMTAPTQDKFNNLFFSGYNPMLLKFLKVGFNAEQFLVELLDEYAKAMSWEEER